MRWLELWVIFKTERNLTTSSPPALVASVSNQMDCQALLPLAVTTAASYHLVQLETAAPDAHNNFV